MVLSLSKRWPLRLLWRSLLGSIGNGSLRGEPLGLQRRLLGGRGTEDAKRRVGGECTYECLSAS